MHMRGCLYLSRYVFKCEQGCTFMCMYMCAYACMYLVDMNFSAFMYTYIGVHTFTHILSST